MMMSSTESTIRTNFRFYVKDGDSGEGGKERGRDALMYAQLFVVFSLSLSRRGKSN